MKRYSLLLIALLCSMQITHIAAMDNKIAIEKPPYYVLKPQEMGTIYAIIAGGTLAFSFIGYKLGQYTSNSKVEIALKKAAEKRSFQEKKEAAAITQHHIITNIKKLAQEFQDIKARCPQPENSSEHLQQQMVKLMIARSQSVTSFATKIADYLDAYSHFDQTTCSAHPALHDDLLWLQRATNIPCAQIKKNQEHQEAITKAKDKAVLDKKKYEAIAAKNLVDNTIQLKQMITNVESAAYRTNNDVRNVSISMRDEYRAHETAMNRKLAAISDAHARPGSEHKEILEGIYDIKQQLHRVTAITNNTQKTTANITDNAAATTAKLIRQQEDKIKQLQEELKIARENERKAKESEKEHKDVVKELEEGLNKAHQEISRLNRPQPSAPSIAQLYPSLSSQPANPPACNPQYRPGQAAYIPAQ